MSAAAARLLDPDSALIAGDADLRAFFASNPEVDLATADLEHRAVTDALDLPRDRSAAILDKLRRRQRLARVAPDAESAAALLDAGLDSAHRIAAVAEHRFVREHAAAFGGDEHEARETHRRAVAVKAFVKHVYANLRDVASPHFRALPGDPVDPALRAYVEDIPDYRELFGTLDYLTCEHCASIFGPAAYFLDVMRITDDYITDANTIPAGYSLRERRPDLFEIDLTCASSDNPLPTLEIVAQILARRIRDEQPVAHGTATAGTATTIALATDASPTDGAYDAMLVAVTAGTGAGQTRTIASYSGATRTATVDSPWHVVPDGTSRYSIARDAFVTLAAAPYPFNLPWNQPLERTRRYLGALGTSPGDVYATFAGPTAAGTAASGAADTIVLAGDASASDGAYAAMRVALVGGRGAGQERTIVAYVGATRTATVTPPWGVAPDAGSAYQVVDTGPADREQLGLSIEERDVVTTPRTSAAALGPYYGVASADPVTLARVDTFLAATGLDRAQLVELLTQGLSEREIAGGGANALWINATGEGLDAMRIVTDATNPNAPVTKIADLSLPRLDRLNRFIRLASRLGWTYEGLDWAMKSVGAAEIDRLALHYLAGADRLRAASGLDVVVLCAFWADMKTTGRGDGAHPADPFDVTFNAPALLAGQDPYTSATPIPFDPARPVTWDPHDTGSQNGVIRARLLAALAVGDNDLTQIARFVAAEIGQPGKPIELTVANLTWLYRLAAGARQLGLTVEQHLTLLWLTYFPGRADGLPPAGALVATVDGILEQRARADWLRRSPFSVASLAYVIEGARSSGFRAPYVADDIAPFIDNLATVSAGSRLGPSSFTYGAITDARSAQIFDELVASRFVSRLGVMRGGEGHFEAAAALFPLSPRSFETQDIGPKEAAAAFAALEAAEPPVLRAVSAGAATLSPWFSSDTDLGFLFVGDADAPNKRNQVRSVLLTAKQRIDVSELAFAFPIAADNFVTPDIDAGGAARILGQLMTAKPPVVVPDAAAGETATVASYDGPTRTATLAAAWTTVPPAGSPYEVIETVASGTAQAGSLSEVTLATTASSVDGAYIGMRIELSAGAGAGEHATITAYDGATKVARVEPAWATLPDATSTYAVTAVADGGVLRAASATTAELAPDASPTNGAYAGATIAIVPTGTLSGLFDASTDLGFLFASRGSGQARTITAYSGPTRSATVDSAWATQPDATSAYRVRRTVTHGTATGGSATTIALAGDASPDDGAYVGMDVEVTAGAGSGQARAVVAYDGASRTATVTPAWTTVPDTTSAYTVVATAASGTARGGGATDILLDPDAAAADGAYVGMTVELVPDPAADLKRGQVARVLLALRGDIEHTGGVVTTAASLQHSNAMQGLAEFLGTTPERLRVLVPIATQAPDLSDYLELLLTPLAGRQVPAEVPPLIARLARTHVLFDQLGTSVDQMRAVAELPRAFNVPAVLKLDYADVRSLSTFMSLVGSLADTDGALIDYLKRPRDADCPGPQIDALSALTGWPTAQICKLIELLWPSTTAGDEYDFTTVAGVARLAECFGRSVRTGLDVESLLEVDSLGTLGLVGGDGQVVARCWQAYERVAALALSAVSAKFAQANLADVESDVAATLNELQRDALVGYAIWLLHAKNDRITGPNALYEYLLIDVEVAGCDITSYIAQGIASVQLYMQRCRMMLERGVTDLSQIPDAWWDWMTAYRVWEANRKVFLYPENYIRPAHRSGATPQFDKLAESLLEKQIDDSTVAEAFRTYFQGFTTVAGLAICAAYETRLPKAGTSVVQDSGMVVSAAATTVRLATAASPLFNAYAGMTVAISAGTGAGQRRRITDYDGSIRQATVATAWDTVPDTTSKYVVTGPRQSTTLLLIGRTVADPYGYYHRRYDDVAGWSPWQEIKVTIPTPYVTPAYGFDKLFLYWTEVKTVDASRIAPGSQTDPGPRSSTLTSTTAAIKFSYLAPDGSWVPPQSTGPDVVTDYREQYKLDKYVDDLLHGWEAYFGGDLVLWLKVYPLHVPATRIARPQAYPNGEQLLVNYGFAQQWMPDQPGPDPDSPPKDIAPDRRQLEVAACELIVRNNALANAPIAPEQGHLPLIQSVIVDATLGKRTLDIAMFDYHADAPQPYSPRLDRAKGTLGIAASNTRNVFLDDYYGDDYPGTFGIDRPPATVALLGHAAGALSSITTVKNRPGSFLFDNGDEAFLVRSSDRGLLTISEAMYATSATPPLPPQNLYLTSQLLTMTQPPPKLADLTFGFTRVTTAAARALAGRLVEGGLPGLLSVASQRTPELPFSRLQPQAQAVPPARDRLDFDGAYGLYFWELFFHAPFLVADTLGANQRFAEAKTWLERIFNPSQQPDPDDATDAKRFWRFLPFRDMTIPSLIQTLTNRPQIETYNDDPFDPDAIARLRISAYAKAVVMRYVTNLLDWADFLFSQDTRESIDQATNLYVMASDILGKRPEALGSAAPPAPANYDQIKQSFTDRTIATGTVAAAGAASVTLAAGASPLNDAYTGMYVEITAGTGSGERAYVVAYDGTTRVAQLDTPWTVVPGTSSQYRVFVQGIPQFLIRLENTKLVAEAVAAGADISDAPFNDVNAYFCVPENDQLTGSWDRVEDRLYKIRHCMNIAGQVRPLPLYAPPINPLELIEGRRAGQASMALAAHVEMPLPQYRFSALLERARTLTAAVSQLGSSLLSALERRDAEALALLQTSQQRTLLDLTTLVKQQQIEDAVQNGTALAASLEGAKGRQAYYGAQITGGLSAAEIANLATMTAATVFNVLATGMRTASAIGYAVPQVGSPFAMTYGGEQLGAVLNAGSGVFEGLATLANFGAQLSATLAQYQRREQEWAMQRDLAGHDVDQITAQIASNEARLTSARRDLDIHTATIAQNDATETFLKSKFTSEELYAWLATRLSTLHFQTYSIALELARSVQRAYQYELGSDQTFVNFGYWNDSRRGLLAGEGLALALNQMEKSYLDRNTRTLEIDRTISLLELNPRALLDLVATGECVFELPELLFDQDFPGHYARRIKTLSVSIPAITGPYQNIHATLTQLTNQLVMQPDVDAVSFLLGTADAPLPGPDALRTNWWVNQEIALSSAAGDDGVFDASLNDERYLPFEGTGAVSSWRLSMPKQTNRIDYQAISDVVVQLRYTAADGGARFRSAVERLPALQATDGSAFLPLAQTFSSQWYAFLHEPPTSGHQTLAMSLGELAPPHVESATVTGFLLHLQVRGHASPAAGRDYLQLRLGESIVVPFDLDALGNHVHTFATRPSTDSIEGPASLSFVLSDTPADLKTKGAHRVLDATVIENAVLVLFYEGRVRWS